MALILSSDKTMVNPVDSRVIPDTVDGLRFTLDPDSLVAQVADGAQITALSDGDLVLNSGAKPVLRHGVLNGHAVLESPTNIRNTTALADTLDGPVTVAMVVKLNGITSAHRLLTGYLSNFLSVSARTEGWSAGVNNNNGSAVSILPTIGWHVIVVVFDGASSRMSVDAVTAELSLPEVTSVPYVRLGADTSGNASLDGQVAQTRIYERALLPADVTQLTTDLQAHYGIS